MKKLFFFRSSSSSGNSNLVSPPSTDKQVYWEKPLDSGPNNQAEKSKTKKQASENHTFGALPSLTRSFSHSSGSIYDAVVEQRNLSCINDRYESPCGSNIPLKQCDHHSSRCCTQKQSKADFGASAVQNANALEKPDCVALSRPQYDTSDSSSYCSSNVSNKVLDRYIDGEQEERSVRRSNSSLRNQGGNGYTSKKHPPRVQYTAPASPTDSMKQKPKSHSFRENKERQPYFASRDWVENGLGNESPRRLARHVIERLSQSRVLPKAGSKECSSGIPITIEDIYSGCFNRCFSSDSDGVFHKSCPLDNPDETSNRCHPRESSGFNEQNCLSDDSHGILNFVETEEDLDEELLRKSKKAEERALLLSEELEQESFLQGSGFSVSALIQTIRSLTDERINMSLEVSAALQDQIAERASAQEKLKGVRVEFDSQIRRLEKEKNELQSALEEELDRRSSEWSLKLEKYQSEEHRLRERVRELAEQNVLLQREVSSFSEREIDSRSRITHTEVQLLDLTARMNDATEENQNLQQSLSELQEKYRAAEEDRDCIQRNYESKERECKELHRSITRLLRTCGEQDKTINGLREGLSEEFRRKTALDDFDNQLRKLRMEQIRLTGVEQALRKEAESYRVEVDSIRHENINLLHRLKDSGKEGGFSTFKLDQELWNRVHCLQSQGLSFLNDSIQLCMKLLEYIKEKGGYTVETKQGIEVTNGLSGQFVIECDMKLLCFRRGLENLSRSLQNVNGVLHEKSNLVSTDCQGQSLPEELGKLNDQGLEVTVKSQLKAETLLTRLLQEKLYSKELDVEQLQAELAAAVRGNDILSCEVQNAMDTLSSVTHKMKDLELQMIKKDENISQLHNDLQEHTKELTIMRGMLPKVSEERDLLWEDVKQYSEKNMLLNSEVKQLKKKIEVLDEDILLKEGQITILKDTLGKPFDLLADLE